MERRCVGLDMEKLKEKEIGHNNPVIILEDVENKICGVNVLDYIRASKGYLTEHVPYPIFIVKRELAEELKRVGIQFTELGLWPMNRETREQIRKGLRKRGVMAPI